MRKRDIFAVLLIGCVCILQVPAALAEPFTFATIPGNGNISGLAGSTIGWGYTVTNPSATNWLEMFGINADSFADGAAQSLFDFPILAPLATVSTSFVANSFGLYQLKWNPLAPTGTVNSGNFVLSAVWWDGDPLGGGNPIGPADDAIAAYSATVSGPAAVPEPSTLALLAGGLIVLCWSKRRQHCE